MDLLRQPIALGSFSLKNPIFFSAASLNYTTDGTVTEAVHHCYVQRAKGGAGLLVVGGIGVDPLRQKKTMLQLCSPAFLPGFQSLCQEIHQNGSACFAQLLHQGGYANPEEYGGLPPLAPSVYQSPMARAETVAMTAEDITQQLENFAAAAAFAKEAGFDGVELCASAGYLLAEFLSPHTNHRTDEYGGTVENRTRFLVEMVQAIQKRCGKDYPVVVRLSMEDGVKDGNTIEDTVAIATLLEQAGVTALSLTCAWHEASMPQLTPDVDRERLFPLCQQVRQAVSLPLLLATRLDVPTARAALEQGICNGVGFCRPLFCDSSVPRKVEQGKEETIFPCLGCMHCLEDVFALRPVRCAVNPLLGKEEHPPLVYQNEKVLIVGAGVAGLTLAHLLSQSNQVTVVEQDNTYGGQGRGFSLLPHMESYTHLLDALYRSCLAQGVLFQFDTQYTGHGQGYDRVYFATGAKQKPLDPLFARHLCATTYQSWQQKQSPIAGNMVIVGEDFKGLQVALSCQARGACVTYVQRAGALGKGLPRPLRWAMVREAKQSGMVLLEKAAIQQVTENSLTVVQEEATHTIHCDTVVTVTDFLPHVPVAEATHFVGDCRQVGRFREAIGASYQAAYGAI